MSILIKDTCMLHKHFMITLPNYWQLNRFKKSEINRHSVDYLFKLTTASSFKNNLKILADTNVVMPAQKTLIAKGSITKDLKLHLLQKSAGVKAEYIGESSKIFKILTDAQLTDLEKLSRTAILDKKELNQLLLTCINNCRTYTNKYVNKKMSFLIKTKQHSLQDISNFLLLEGLQALMFTYPRFEGELHAVNIMKATIHNVGMNYIETHTRLKRNHYDSDGMMRIDSFTGVDANTGEANEKTFSGEDSRGLLYTKDNSEITQLESDVVDLTSKYKGRKAKIINLLMGTYDESFTRYLNNRGTTRYTNDDYFENVKSSKYIELIFDYLDYDHGKGFKFINSLKENLSDYQ